MKNNISSVAHLDKSEMIKSGSIFTPKHLTELIVEKSLPFIDSKTTVIDMGAGYGAFIEVFQNIGKQCFGTEIDHFSSEILKQNFPNNKIFCENSLLNVSRKKYGLSNKDKLFIVGNPPYNDTTSIYQKGKKGEIICDEDIKSRDIGICFLKAYHKLNADYVFVLHPLAYLIKKTNLKALGKFKDNYKLISGTLFSSKEFDSIKSSKSDFPIVAALYERNSCGTSLEYINNFSFDILNSEKKFCLKNIKTIDGIVQKYPKKNEKTALQYYTLRDMNALMRNASFVNGPITNGINLYIDTLYQYAWLFFLKKNFAPKNYKFLYGNLSPLYSESIEKQNIKNLLISYAYYSNKNLKTFYTKNELEKIYGSFSASDNYSPLYDILNKTYI